MREVHKLAVVMFTDLVGYSTVMNNDEKEALSLLELNISIQVPLIKKFNGILTKKIGDGTLTIFESVSDAIYCAYSIINTYKRKSRISIRIGIHLGEIVFSKDDVFGNGVNIASRIQATAMPNTILVSEAVFREINNKKGIVTKFFEKRTLKNIKDPMKLYKVYAIDQNLINKGEERSMYSGFLKSSKSSLISVRFVFSTGEIVIIILLIYIAYKLWMLYEYQPFAMVVW